MESVTSPIFIVSSERSGSNLLRTLLGNHSHISAPISPQFIPVFHRLVMYYQPLSEEENAYHLLEDMLSLANHPYYGWALTMDIEDVYHRYRPQVFLDFFHLLYEEYRAREDKQRFVCKENNLFDFAFQLWRHYGQARFIYLYRDPRDYVASFMNVPAGFKTVYNAAVNWKVEQEKCEVLSGVFGLPMHRVRYEDLITDTPGVMKGVLAFLEEPVEESCFEVQTDRNRAAARNVYWKNLTKPVMRSNSGKYRTLFAAQDINIIETVAYEQMIRLGYDLESRADWRKPRFFQIRNALVNRMNRRRMRKAHTATYTLLSSRNDQIKAIVQKRKKEWLRRQGRISQT
ncbi:sulfotransferase, partial [Candidatus Parcubacteria bacterium]